MQQSGLIKTIAFCLACGVGGAAVGFFSSVAVFVLLTSLDYQLMGDPSELIMYLSMLVCGTVGVFLGITRCQNKRTHRPEWRRSLVDQAEKSGWNYRISAPVTLVGGWLLSLLFGTSFVVVVVNPILLICTFARAVFVAVRPDADGLSSSTWSSAMRFTSSLVLHAVLAILPTQFLAFYLMFS